MDYLFFHRHHLEKDTFEVHVHDGVNVNADLIGAYNEAVSSSYNHMTIQFDAGYDYPPAADDIYKAYLGFYAIFSTDKSDLDYLKGNPR